MSRQVCGKDPGKARNALEQATLTRLTNGFKGDSSSFPAQGHWGWGCRQCSELSGSSVGPGWAPGPRCWGDGCFTASARGSSRVLWAVHRGLRAGAFPLSRLPSCLTAFKAPRGSRKARGAPRPEWRPPDSVSGLSSGGTGSEKPPTKPAGPAPSARPATEAAAGTTCVTEVGRHVGALGRLSPPAPASEPLSRSPSRPRPPAPWGTAASGTPPPPPRASPVGAPARHTLPSGCSEFGMKQTKRRNLKQLKDGCSGRAAGRAVFLMSAHPSPTPVLVPAATPRGSTPSPAPDSRPPPPAQAKQRFQQLCTWHPLSVGPSGQFHSLPAPVNNPLLSCGEPLTAGALASSSFPGGARLGHGPGVGG